MPKIKRSYVPLFNFIMQRVLYATLAVFTVALTLLAVSDSKKISYPDPEQGWQPPANSASAGRPPVRSCAKENEGTPCAVSGRRGFCTLNQETSLFGCFVMPEQSRK